MNPSTPIAQPDALRSSTLVGRWTDLLVSPADVFESLKGAPVSWVNWLLPVLLATSVSAFFYCLEIDQQVPRMDAGDASLRKLNGLMFIGGANISGLLWSAALLWLTGRFLLKATFPFFKAMEVTGLCSLILTLTLIVTHLLVVAKGDAFARPALSLLIDTFDPANRFHVALGTMNFMHLWLAGVLASGLAKLSNAPFGEAAFWVFGYWIGLRLVLALLGSGAVVL